MSKKTLTEDTVITIGQDISLEKYRTFFRKTVEGFSPEVFCGDFQSWLNTNAGKTLREAIEDYYKTQSLKIMEEILTERRFDMISKADKDFIISFDKEIARIGYDFGGKIGSGFCWGPYMIIYAKTGVKSKQVNARIFIRENGIVLRLFFNNVDKHKAYIENAPEHIKSVFISNHGNCGYNPKKEHCRMRKTYTIDGKFIEKCSGVVFEFWNPSMEKLPDYIGLLVEFYPVKKSVKLPSKST